MLRLARETGFIDVEELLASTSAAQIQEHIEDYRIDMWPEDRLALQLAMIGAAIVNELKIANVGKVKETKLAAPKDFIPDFKEPAEESELTQHEALVSRFLAAGAVIKPRETNAQ